MSYRNNEIEALEREYQRIRDNDLDSASSSPSSSITILPQDLPLLSPISDASNIPPEVLRRLHASLESAHNRFGSQTLPTALFAFTPSHHPNKILLALILLMRAMPRTLKIINH
jgi:hypothetical protein